MGEIKILQNMTRMYYRIGNEQSNFWLGKLGINEAEAKTTTKYKQFLDFNIDDIDDRNYLKKQCNSRTLLGNELLISYKKRKYETDSELAERLIKSIRFIERIQKYICYATEGIGYDLHIYFSDNVVMSKTIKKKINLDFNCDDIRAGTDVMIELENASHWKTGNIKRFLDSNFMENDRVE